MREQRSRIKLIASRRQEIAQLDALLERARQGYPQIVLVPGLSGQGKSSLIEHFIETSLKTFPTPVVYARGLSSNPTTPYHVWYNALAFALESDSSNQHSSKDRQPTAQIVFDVLRSYAPDLLASIIEIVAGGLGNIAVITYRSWREIREALKAGNVRRGVCRDEERKHEKTFENQGQVIQRQIERLSKDGLTLIFFLDDLQWADASSISLLQQIANVTLNTHGDHRRMLFILAYRSNEIRTVNKRGEQHPMMEVEQELVLLRYRTLVTPLFGLTGGVPANPPSIQVQEYVDVRYLPGRSEFPYEFLQQVQAWTGGEAQFVHELFNLWEDTGQIQRRTVDRVWVLNSIPRLDEVADKSAAVMQRLQRLQDDTLDVLVRASVDAFRDEIFVQQVIAGTFLVPTTAHRDITSQIRLLRDSHGLIEVAGEIIRQAIGHRFDAYRFSHTLIREVAYRHFLEPETRASLHLAIAHEMERVFADNLDGVLGELADHYRCGEEPTKSAFYLLRLLQQRIDRKYFAEAEAALSRLQQLSEMDLQRNERSQVRFACRLGQAALLRIQDENTAHQIFTDLQTTFEFLGITHPGLRARYLQMREDHLSALSTPDRRLRLAVIDEFVTANEPTQVLEVLKDTASKAFAWGIWSELNVKFTEIETWLKQTNTWEKFAADFLIARSNLVSDELDGKTKAKQLRKIALDIAGTDEQRFQSLIALAHSMTETHDLDQALELTTQAQALATSRDRIDWQLTALMRQGAIYRNAGKADEFHQTWLKRLELAQATGMLHLMPGVWNDYGFGMSYFGRKRSALEAYSKVEQLNQELGKVGHLVGRHNIAAIKSVLGQFDAAWEEFTSLRNIGQRNADYARYTNSLLGLADILCRRRCFDEAVAAYTEALTICRGEATFGNVPKAISYRNVDREQIALRDLALAFTQKASWDDAQQMMNLFEAQYVGRPGSYDMNLYWSVKAYFLGLTGVVDASVKMLEDILHIEGYCRLDRLSQIQLYLAEILVKSQPEAALTHAQQSLTYADPEGVYWRPDLRLVIAKALTALNKKSEAIEHLGKARAEFEQMRIIPGVAYTDGLLAQWVS